jgi:hypothetical protein
MLTFAQRTTGRAETAAAAPERRERVLLLSNRSTLSPDESDGCFGLQAKASRAGAIVLKLVALETAGSRSKHHSASGE